MSSSEDGYLRRLVLELVAYSTGQAGLGLLDGSKAGLRLHGAAFLATPRRKGTAGSWIRRTAMFKTLQAAGTPLPTDGLEFFLAVQWHRLLGKGLLQHETLSKDIPAGLRRLSHYVWWTLLPVIRKHDAVMAQLIEGSREKFRSQMSRTAIDPFWVGFDTEEDQRRFDAQAVALLNSRRTDARPLPGFVEDAVAYLNDGLRLAIHQPLQRTIGLCDSGAHSRGTKCPTCPEIHNERPLLTVLNVTLMSESTFRNMLSFPTVTEKPAPPDLFAQALRWILDCRYPADGVLRFTAASGSPARFIDFGRVRARWAELGGPTIFDGVTEHDRRGGPAASVSFFSTALQHAVLPSTVYNERHLFLTADWGRLEDYDPLYGGYVAVYDATLITMLERVDQRSASLAKAQLARPRRQAHQRPVRRVVVREYISALGVAHPVGIVRSSSQGKRVHNFYTTPFEVEGPLVDEPRMRTGLGLLVDSKFYWNTIALNKFANEVTESGAPVYEEARAFCEWANHMDAQLVDRKAFNAAVYSDRLSVRVQAVQNGERAHLGPYSEYEDQQIVQFFVENPPKKRLTPEAWAALLQRLPGRSERSILRRFEELGKKYAFTHGYAAYSRSPYCRKFSAQRRRHWIKEGCAA